MPILRFFRPGHPTHGYGYGHGSTFAGKTFAEWQDLGRNPYYLSSHPHFQPDSHICVDNQDGLQNAVGTDYGAGLFCIENSKPVLRGIQSWIDTQTPFLVHWDFWTKFGPKVYIEGTR